MGCPPRAATSIARCQQPTSADDRVPFSLLNVSTGRSGVIHRTRRGGNQPTEENTMRLRTKAASAAVGTVVLFSGVSVIPAGAQQTAQGVEEDDDGFDDWGLFGLAGLLGLAGLAGL